MGLRQHCRHSVEQLQQGDHQQYGADKLHMEEAADYKLKKRTTTGRRLPPTTTSFQQGSTRSGRKGLSTNDDKLHNEEEEEANINDKLHKEDRGGDGCDRRYQ